MEDDDGDLEAIEDGEAEMLVEEVSSEPVSDSDLDENDSFRFND